MDENKLAQLKTKFTSWRTSRKKGRGPIPDDLWEEVVRLYEQEPSFKIKKELKLPSSRWTQLLSKNKKINSTTHQVIPNNFIAANMPVSSGVQVIIKFPSGVEVKVL